MWGGAGNRNCKERREEEEGGDAHYGKEYTNNEGEPKDEVRGEREAWRKMIEMAGEGRRWIGERLRR